VLSDLVLLLNVPIVVSAHDSKLNPLTNRFKTVRKEFLRDMSTDEPELTTVTSKGQITIPSRLRDEFGYEKGTKLMVVPTEHGLVLKKIELPSVEEFQVRVEERSEAVEMKMAEIDALVHDARGADE